MKPIDNDGSLSNFELHCDFGDSLLDIPSQSLYFKNEEGEQPRDGRDLE